jgi:hypothetical protein
MNYFIYYKKSFILDSHVALAVNLSLVSASFLRCLALRAFTLNLAVRQRMRGHSVFWHQLARHICGCVPVMIYTLAMDQ